MYINYIYIMNIFTCKSLKMNLMDAYFLLYYPIHCNTFYNPFLGSNVPVLCKVIPKLFLHSTGLLFSNDISLLPLIRSSSLLPRITGLTGFGREKLELAEVIIIIMNFTVS